MGHAAVSASHGAAHLGRDNAVHRRKRGHVVFHVVHAGQQDLGLGDDALDLVIVAAVDHAVAAEHAVGERLLAAEIQHAALRLLAEAGGVGVVAVHYQHVVGGLVSEDLALGVDVVVKVRVLVEVVRRDVGDDGDVGAYVDAVQLEARELQHGDVVRLEVRYLAQQRLADVAAEVHAPASGLEQLGNDGRGGGLAVGARDAYRAAGAEAEEDLHLAGDDRAARLCLDEGGVRGQQARGAEDVIKAIEVVEVAGSEPELGAACA